MSMSAERGRIERFREGLFRLGLKWMLLGGAGIGVSLGALLRMLLLERLSKEWLLSIIVTLSGLCLCLSAYLLYFLLMARLRPAFGLLWDREFNAHCPKCRGMLVNIQKRTVPDSLALRETGLCLGCNVYISASMEHLPVGTERSMRNAMRYLRGEPLLTLLDA